jgi:hypothetical protein
MGGISRAMQRKFEKRLDKLRKEQAIKEALAPRPVSRLPYLVRAVLVRPPIALLWIVCDLFLHAGLVYRLPGESRKGCRPWDVAVWLQERGLDLAEWARSGRWKRPDPGVRV